MAFSEIFLFEGEIFLDVCSSNDRGPLASAVGIRISNIPRCILGAQSGGLLTLQYGAAAHSVVEPFAPEG